MMQVSEDRIETVAAAVESDPSTVGDDDLTALLDGIAHPDYTIHSPAGDALEDLVEGLSDEEIDARFDADRLRGRVTTESYSGGTALSTVLETLAETNPDAVRALRPEIRAGLGEYLQESTIKEILCAVLAVETELVEEARTLMTAENSTARNVGVRLINEIAGDGYDIDGAYPDAVEPALPDVWDVLKNGRENSKPRENAATALATHAAERPDAYTDRIEEVAAVLRTTESKIRYDLFDLPQAVASHDPDAVVPLAPVARREFTGVTGTSSTEGAAIGLLAALVDTHPEVISSLDPFLDRVTDDSERYDEEAAEVVAAVGGPDHAEALLGAGEFTTELIATLADGLDDESRAAVRETVRGLVSDADSEIRMRAVSTVRDVFHDEFDDPAAIYLDRLGDDAGGRYDSVRERAANGLERVADENPSRLTGDVDRLLGAAEAAIDADDYAFSTLVAVLAALAVADDEVYARVAGDVGADDPAARYVAIRLLSEVATEYPSNLPDPVPTLLNLHGADEDRELALDGHIRSILGGLAYVRPGAVEPVSDRAVEWYEAAADTGTGYRRFVADLAPAYPEVPTALVEPIADDYIDSYTGDYSLDDPDAAVALGHAAIREPDRVRSAVDPLLGAEGDSRPASFPLVLLGLGDHDAIPDDFADEGGWLAERLIETDHGSHQLRLTRLLAAAEYDPAEPLLETVAADAAASETVADVASDALDRLS